MDTPLCNQVVAISPVQICALSHSILWYMPMLALHSLREREPELIHYDDTFFDPLRTLILIITITEVAGCIMCAILMKFIGRRVTHRIFTAAGVIALPLIWFAPDIHTLKAGSAFAGLSIGGFASLGLIMIGEYASPKYRQVFLYLNNFMVLVGGVAIDQLIPVVSQMTIAMIALAPLVISFAVIQVTPESPMWLASRKNYNESERVFYKLRGEDPGTAKEIREIIETQEALHTAEVRIISLRKHILTFLSKFISSELLKPFRIIVIAILVQEFSGRNYLMIYSIAPNSSEFNFKDVSAFYIHWVNILMSVSALVSVVLIKNYKQRALLFSTGFLACAILAMLSFFSALITFRRGAIIDTVLYMYSFLTNLCCSHLPFVLVGELFPLEHKGVGAAATWIVSRILALVINDFTEYILEQRFNIHWILPIYSAVTSVCLLILYVILPETKDLTLQEIENKFVKRNISRHHTELQGAEAGWRTERD